MKRTIQVAVLTVLIVVGAWLFYQGGRIAVGTDEESIVVNDYEQKMLTAREGFLEKPDEIQYLAQALMDSPGLTIVSDSAMAPWIETAEGLQDPADVLEADTVDLLRTVMGSYENGARVYNIQVTERAVLFYTDYSADGGCCGLLYEIVPDSTDYYDYIELVEGDSEESGLGRWLIFYRLPEGH